MLPWQWLKLRGFKSYIFENIFSIPTSEMESAAINTKFCKFHPQTNEIKRSEVERFSMKTLKFRHDYDYDYVIYDISEDSGILFGMWNRLVMSYLCAKFCCDHHNYYI